MGFDRIAQKLNDEGIEPRRGKQWWGLTVNKILTGKGRRPAMRKMLSLAIILNKYTPGGC